MPTLSGLVAVSKAALISSSLVIGTGTMYILYQMYTFSKHLKRVNCQLTILTDRLFRAEADILQLRRKAEPVNASGDSEQVVVSDDGEDEFLDAEDSEHGSGVVPNGVHHPNKSKKGSLEAILSDLDSKLQNGGLDKLKYCHRRLVELSKIHPTDAEVYWRASKAAYLLAEEENLVGNQTKERHQELMIQAKDSAEKAIKLNPKSGQGYKWMTITLGSLTEHMPVQDQIKNAYAIKENAEKAILYIPTDATMHHIMGRWCYSVYMMSWLERKLASALFSTPPTATLEEAITYLEKAESLDPMSSVSNELFLAKSFIEKKEYKTALKYLKTGEALKCSSKSDQTSMKKIHALHEQYKHYDKPS